MISFKSFGPAVTGIRAVSVLVDQTVRTAVRAKDIVGSAAANAAGVAANPVRAGVKTILSELPVSTWSRNCWRGEERAWIEVRGLNRPDGVELGHAVVEALSAQPGVHSANLNRPLSRVVVGLSGDRPSLRDLCRLIEEAEERHGSLNGSGHRSGAVAADPTPLPADGRLLAVRAATVGADAAGLAVALVGKALRWLRLPVTASAAVSAMNHQPWLRGLLESQLGKSSTENALKVIGTATYILSLAPASLAVDLMSETLKAAESRAGAQAWRRHEPDLARHAHNPQLYPPLRPLPPPGGPIERHARHAALAQAIAAATAGAATRNLDTAANATIATAPKAMRATRESFAATLGRGLADRHAVLPLRPDSLRRLDRIDTLVVDPRILCGQTLRVMRISGADDDQFSTAWNTAQQLLEKNGLRAGWHQLPGTANNKSASRIKALISPAHDPLASAVLAQARSSALDLVSVDADMLGELRPVFDQLHVPRNGSVTDALTAALADLQASGRFVALVSADVQALSSADVGLGVMPVSGAEPPPWTADLISSNLAGVWQVLHALPAARAASQRGIEIASAATALGALLMLPGVRLRGPAPVTTGAAAGLLSGYLMARKVVGTSKPTPAPAHEWHAMSAEQVRKLLPSPDAVESPKPRRATLATRAVGTAQRSGEFAARPGRAVWQFAKAVRAELDDPLTPVLALGSTASAILGSPVDAVLVGSVLSGNAVLAATQRLRAESRLNHLLAQQVPPARKVTTGPDGTPLHTDVAAEQLRPGDVIEVRTHEVVPADARLIEEEDLEVDESTLSGELLPVPKQVAATPGANLADRRCMLFAGTTVVTGRAQAVVTAVGGDTQERRAACLVVHDQAAVGLQHQLSQLTNRAFPFSAAGGALVGLLGILRRQQLRQAVASAIAITVAAVPEGMPLVATLAQAASARHLTTRGVLVRVPRSIEALGRIDVVCFDKTGTLSENRLQVKHVHATEGYAPEDVLRTAARATPVTSDGASQVHATDRAIIEAARVNAGPNGSRPTTAPDAHLPFRPGRSFSASVTGDELTVKGAPEVVLAACSGVDSGIDRTVQQLANEGLRVIATARRRLTPDQAELLQRDEDAIYELCREHLSLIGFLGLSDTPRADTRELLEALAEREVGVRLITGDHPMTATAIARELGMPVTAQQVISGAEWAALSRKDQERAVTDRVIFARMSPENKVQIVQTLERIGKVCAMVGDGSNDAAAIRAATVGVAVVARGSDPARAVADVVLMDGRIDALLHAIDEGAQLWRRVQAAVSVLLGGNAGEVAFAVIGAAVTGTSPLNTRQLLLVNMLTDALPAAALAVSSLSNQRQPGTRGLDEKVLWRAVGVRGTTTAGAATAAWALARVTGGRRRASTVALVALVSAQLGQTLLDSHAPLVILTTGGSLAAMATLISMPGVSQLLGCTPLGPIGWVQALGAAGAATVAVPIANRMLTDRRPSGPPSNSELCD